MTMQLTPSRSPLAETVMVKDWAMRRLDQRELPESSLAGLSGRHTGTPAQRQWKVNPLGAMRHTGTKAQRTWTVNPLGETVMVKDWAMRRLDQRELPESSLQETVMVKDWAMRRLDQRELPESSLAALSGRHTGTPAQRRWGINRLGETVYVNDTVTRRYGMTPPDALAGFGAFGANAQMTVRVDDVQRAARRLGICNGPNGRLLAIDNNLGPQTRGVLQEMATRFTPQLADPISGDETDGVHSVMIDSELWTAVTTAASNPTAIDTCSSSTGSGSGGGTTTDTGTHTTDAPPEDLPMEEEVSWYENPWYWVAAAAVVGVVGFAYYQSSQPQDGGEIIEESWERTLSPTF